MSELGPVDEAELITAAAAHFQERHPDAVIARVEVYDMAEMEAKGMRCTRCHAVIPSCFWIQLCDACLERAFT